jgi:hypothetical protein
MTFGKNFAGDKDLLLQRVDQKLFVATGSDFVPNVI